MGRRSQLVEKDAAFFDKKCFPRVHAPGKNGWNFICGCGCKLCEAFPPLWQF